jgi:PAS domain S-box-containing protein
MAKKPTYEELEKRVKELEKEALEHKQAEDKEKQYIRELEFLSKTATEFVELSLEENIYQFIGKKLTKLIGESIVIVNSFSEKSGRSCSRAILGLGKRTEAVIKILGADPVGKTFEVEDEGIRALTGGKLHKIPGGIYRLTPEIPKAAFRAIQKLLALGDAYSMGFSWGGKLFGNVVILLRQGCELGNQNIIEIFMRQASVSLQRKGAEEALRKAHDELEMRVDERTAELVKTNERLKREIEERKRAEEALRQSEQRYRSLVEAAIDIIFSLSTDGIITSLNPAFETITGWSRAEWLGKSFKPIIHPHDLPFAMELFQRVLQGKKAPIYELRVLSKTGEYLTGQFTSTPQIQNGKVVTILGIARDVTERKKAEKEIRKLSSAVEQSIDGIAIADLEPKLTYVNDAFAAMHGYSPGEMIGMKAANLHNEEQVGEYKIGMNQIKTLGSYMGEIDHIRKDGIAFPTYMSVTLLKDEKGKPTGILAVCRDITDRRRAEEELRIKDSAIASSINAIAMADLEGKLIYVNDSFLKQWGYDDEKEVLGKSAVKFWQVEESALEVIEALRDRGGWVGELVAMKKDGSLFDVQVSSTIVAHETGRPICMMASFVDISERKRAEEALREREAELEIKTTSLEEVNTTLRVLLKRRDEDKTEVEEKVLVNVKELVVPFLEKMKNSPLDPKQVAYIHILESNLNDIVSPFLRTLSAKYVSLTPTEIQVANLIKEGKATKEIAELLNLSSKTINTHRQNIRRKLGLKNKKVNLRSHLLTLQQ